MYKMAAPAWMFDRHRGLRYYIDFTTRHYVYEDGNRLPLPDGDPRTAGPSNMPGEAEPTASSVSTTSRNYQYGAGTGSSPPTEQMVRTFRAPERPRDYFTQYRVFAMQPDPQEAEPSAQGAWLSNFADAGRRYQGVRRYVVIQEADPEEKRILALPILSYRGQGVGAPGVVKHEHGIAYTGKVAPEAGDGEKPTRDESPMMTNAIRVKQHDLTEPLHLRSRINYGQPTWIPLTAEVHDIGSVHKDSRGFLVRQYQHVQRRKREEEERKKQQDQWRSEAAHLQAEWRVLKAKGQHDMAIYQVLTAEYQRTHPSLSWEQAFEAVKRLLRY